MGQAMLASMKKPGHIPPLQRVAVIQLANAGMDIKTPTDTPAARVLTITPTFRRAFQYGLTLQSKTPDIGQILFWPCGWWTLIPSEVMPTTKEEGEERLNELLKNHAEEQTRKASEFKERVDAFEDGDRDAEIKELISINDTRKTLDLYEELATYEGEGKQTALIKSESDQEYVVVSFITSNVTDFQGDAAVMIHGAFETKSEAQEFVAESASAFDYDMIVAKSGAWLFPELLYTKEGIEEIETTYHDTKLDGLMKYHKMEQKISAASSPSDITVIDSTIEDVIDGVEFDFVNQNESRGAIETK